MRRKLCMFVPYFSDVYPDYRPWLAYLTFPAFVIFSFFLVANGNVPAMDSMNLGPMFRIDGILLSLYMLGGFFVLWTLGKAVCSKIGNFRYVTGLFILFVSFAALSWQGEDFAIVWFLSWFVNGIAGIYLVFYPENSIDCFVLFPPFRSFSIAGYWLVLFWLIADFLFALILGWYLACLLHPLAFVLGLCYAALLLKVGRIEPHPDERTLWQVLRHTRREDRFWQSSWSMRRQQEQAEQAEWENSDRQVRQELSRPDLANKKETPVSSGQPGDLAVLCPCGRVNYLSLRDKKEGVCCPGCGHIIYRPAGFEDS